MTYKVQIDDVVRDATPEEVAELEARQEEWALRAAAEEAAVAAKASAKAKLAALGLTEEEINALTGRI
jgi:hypothetical protein